MGAKSTLMEKARGYFNSASWKNTWDKITTGILIALMATPILILTYIILWFTLK